MAAILKEHGVKSLLATFAHTPHFENHYASTAVYQKGFADHNEMVKEVAGSHDLLLLDLAALMPQEKRYWSDEFTSMNKEQREKQKSSPSSYARQRAFQKASGIADAC